MKKLFFIFIFSCFYCFGFSQFTQPRTLGTNNTNTEVPGLLRFTNTVVLPTIDTVHANASLAGAITYRIADDNYYYANGSYWTAMLTDVNEPLYLDGTGLHVRVNTYQGKGILYADVNRIAKTDSTLLAWDEVSKTLSVDGSASLGTTTQFNLNAIRFQIYASSFNGVVYNVGSGTAGGGVYDVSKRHSFKNRGNTYLDIGSIDQTHHYIKSPAGVDYAIGVATPLAALHVKANVSALTAVIIEDLGTYANDAAATSAGLTAGMLYKTSAGVLMIKL